MAVSRRRSFFIAMDRNGFVGDVRAHLLSGFRRPVRALLFHRFILFLVPTSTSHTTHVQTSSSASTNSGLRSTDLPYAYPLFACASPMRIFRSRERSQAMKIKVVVHEAEEGGFWAEVPALPGCATQGETMDELVSNLKDAIDGCLSVDVAEPKPGGKERILEIAL